MGSPIRNQSFIIWDLNIYISDPYVKEWNILKAGKLR